MKKLTDQDKTEIYNDYVEKFGPSPYIGLDERALDRLFNEMQKALDGKRKGNISYEEFYGKIDIDMTI